MVDAPASVEDAVNIEIMRGPNIKPFPKTEPLADNIDAPAVLKVGDNITTDHIMPAGAKILPYRSNIPFLSNFCFVSCDKDFPENCKKAGKGIIIGGENYGQGSSREHAALVPLYLGIKAVIAKSFARIHSANLVNAGILPLIFKNPSDYDKITQGDDLAMSNLKEAVQNGNDIAITNKTKNEEYVLQSELSGRSKGIVLAGGLLPYTKENS